MRERGDGFVGVELRLQHAGALKAVYRLPVCGTAVVIAGENQLRLAGTGDAVLSRAVHIAVSVAGDCDRLLPGTHNRRNPFDHDRRAENRAVQNGADCAVGAFPHLGKVVFLHALGVGGDGGALDRHAVFFVCVGGVHRHLIFGFLTVHKAQVIIFGFQIDKRQNHFILNLFPQDAGHLIAVHLHQGGRHLDFFHRASSNAACCLLYPPLYCTPRVYASLRAGFPAGPRAVCGAFLG